MCLPFWFRTGCSYPSSTTPWNVRTVRRSGCKFTEFLRHPAVVPSPSALLPAWQEPCFDAVKGEMRELHARTLRLGLQVSHRANDQLGLKHDVPSVQTVVYVVQRDLERVVVFVIERPEVAVQTTVQLWITAMEVENELCRLPDFPVEFPSSIHEDHVRLVCSPPLPG